MKRKNTKSFAVSGEQEASLIQGNMAFIQKKF
jgi:hypothetical protein